MPSAAGLMAIATVAVAGWFARHLNKVRYESEADRRSASDRPIPGAEPVSLDGGVRGLLILHGFGDTPQSVHALAQRMHEGRWSVRAPLLHGHGRSLQDFTQARAEDWLSDARRALDELREGHDRVAIIGQSMGGALGTILGADGRVDALVLLAPYLGLSPRAARIAAFHRFVTPFVPYLPSRSEFSILDPDARRRALGLGVTTPRLLHELSKIVEAARRAAPLVRTPVLVIHSRNDPRIPVTDAEAAFHRLGSPEKRLEWAARSGHVLSVDFDHDRVAQLAADWLDRHTRAGQPSPGN